MVLSFRIAFTALLLLSGISTAALALFAYRRREVPGALPFAALAGAMAYWAVVYALGLQITGNEQLRIALLQVQWLSHPTIPLFLFLFGVTYTGHDDFLTARTLALIAAIPATVVLAAWTNPWHHLLWTDQAIHVVDGMAVLVPTYGPLFWINIVYGYGIEFIAIAALVRLIYTSEYLYRDQSALLLVGIAVPFVANVVEIFVIGATPAVDPTAIMYVVTAVAFGYALFRRELFELIPATRHLGQNAAIGQLDTGVVIVDTDHRIVYANTAAGDVFDCEPADVLGRRAGDVVDEDWLDFDAEDALAEVERDDRVYEVRTSDVTDRTGSTIGHTLVFHDVTARKRREEELSTVNDLNAVIRGVNQALVSATSRVEIERAVADHLADSGLYDRACVGDVRTWRGEADRWRAAGEDGTDGEATSAADSADAGDAGPDRPSLDVTDVPAAPTTDGTTLPIAAGDDWLVVPVVYGRTVYGAIGLSTDREDVSDRERAVLGELGELVGHAIDAVESRALFDADTIQELSVTVENDDPIAAATSDGARLEVLGVVPHAEDGHLAHLEVTAGDAASVRERLAAAGVTVRVPPGTEDVLEVVVDPSLSLSPIVTGEAHLLGGTVADGTATYHVLVPGDAARTLLDRLEAVVPSTTLRSKAERDHPLSAGETIPEQRLEELTDRQRETLEAAVRAGYFEWPRDADAETVADELDISSSTMHGHLRKAQGTLLAALFETDERD